MFDVQRKQKQERALLVGLEQDGVSKWDLRDSLDELRELANSAGAQVVDTVTQKLEAPTFDQIFKNEELRKEFENLTRKLDAPSS
jgi:50S ribosomal subunit-associated GTPase HflX